MCLLIAALLPNAALAQSAEGFFEVRGHAYAGVDGDAFEVVERLRPELEAPLGERVVLASTVEARLHQGRDVEHEVYAFVADTVGGVTVPEHDNELLGVDIASDYLSVERLYLDVFLPQGDLRLGRQAVNWGSGFMVNPTDPFPEVLLTQPWKPRSGVNAARFTLPVGDRHQVQAVAGVDDTLTHPRLAARGTVNVAGTDVSLVGAWREEASDGIVGLDIKGTAGVGFWLEGALHLGEGEPYEDVAIGLDYSFPVLDSLVLSAQYYRNGAGDSDVSYDELLGAWTGVDTGDPFAPFLQGRDYAMGALALGVTPEIGANLLYVQNLGDGSALLVPTVSTYPKGWLEISAAAQVPLKTWGDGGELSPSDDDLSVPMGWTTLDLSGLVPTASFILWTRASF